MRTETLHIQRNPGAALIIFFQGDLVQEIDTEKGISRLQDPRVISSILSAKFGPEATIIVIGPSSRREGPFSCYDHFFDNLEGDPSEGTYRTQNFKASVHLQHLLQHDILAPHIQHIDVVGFSKGGIILNQLLTEVAAFWKKKNSNEPLPVSAPLLERLRAFHYLDVGLNCAGAYLTDPDTVNQLGERHRKKGNQQDDFLIKLHGTPRQWEDPRRPFLRAERDRMVELCRGAGVPIQVEHYFQGEKPSLKMHFEVIKEMRV